MQQCGVATLSHSRLDVPPLPGLPLLPWGNPQPGACSSCCSPASPVPHCSANKILGVILLGIPCFNILKIFILSHVDWEDAHKSSDLISSCCCSRVNLSSINHNTLQGFFSLCQVSWKAVPAIPFSPG